MPLVCCVILRSNVVVEVVVVKIWDLFWSHLGDEKKKNHFLRRILYIVVDTYRSDARLCFWLLALLSTP